MITTCVQFRLPQPMSLAEAREAFLASAPRYRDMPGLLRKMYVRSEDGLTAGGIYLWRTRADAERAYDEAWRAFVTAKYGSAPTVAYWDSPVIVDNLAGEIVSDPAA